MTVWCGECYRGFWQNFQLRRFATVPIIARHGASIPTTKAGQAQDADGFQESFHLQPVDRWALRGGPFDPGDHWFLDLCGLESGSGLQPQT